ncbi:MAG: hypothetical protein OEL88_13265 [Sterolibacteriaceae bacterium MAG5]|nr:hypothetical protein [Candidatus Nitricoxidireducens bremensis]
MSRTRKTHKTTKPQGTKADARAPAGRLADGSRFFILEDVPTNPRALPVRVNAARRQGRDTIYPPSPFDKRVNPTNAKWAGFRPDWLRDAEKPVRVAPVNFEHLRRHVLSMTLEQCAAFLRVGAANVAAWEAGLEAIPYAAYLALRMAGELQYLPHSIKEWADFKIIGSGPDVGKLLDTRTGEMFSPGEIVTIRYAYAQASSVLAENHRLKQQMKAMQDEVERLRTLRQIDGVTRELEGMQEKIGALLNGLNHGVPPAIRLAVPSQREEVLQNEAT